MAWSSNGNNLSMCEGDWGIQLPVKLDGTTLTAQDCLRFTFKTEKNGNTLFTKEYSNIEGNTVNLELTEAESALLPTGIYAYSLDWYQDGAFLCNITPSAQLKVVDKA